MMNKAIDIKISKQAYWQSKIKEWQESNLNQSAFCRQSGIKLSTFIYWRSLFLAPENNNSNKFIPVKVVKDGKENKSKCVKIKLVTGHLVYFPKEMDSTEMAKLIQLIGKSHV
jgi:hypothetical protein